MVAPNDDTKYSLGSVLNHVLMHQTIVGNEVILVIQDMLLLLLSYYTLGSTFIPSTTHSGGLRYHGMFPMVSHLVDLGLIQAKAYGQKECFEAGIKFANVEGIITCS